jgi:hypothetical protein
MWIGWGSRNGYPNAGQVRLAHREFERGINVELLAVRVHRPTSATTISAGL